MEDPIQDAIEWMLRNNADPSLLVSNTVGAPRAELNMPGLSQDIPPVWQHLIKTTPLFPKAERKGSEQFSPRDVPASRTPAGQKIFDPRYEESDWMLAQAKESPDDKLLQWMRANQQPPTYDPGDNKGAV